MEYPIPARHVLMFSAPVTGRAARAALNVEHSVLAGRAFSNPKEDQNQADPQQDMADARHAGQSAVHGGGQGRPQHLSHAPEQKGKAGQIQAHMVHGQHLPRPGARESHRLLQQQEQQEKYHAQHEVVGVDGGEHSLTLKAVELGKFAVEHAEKHGNHGVGHSGVGIALHKKFLLISHSS